MLVPLATFLPGKGLTAERSALVPWNLGELGAEEEGEEEEEVVRTGGVGGCEDESCCCCWPCFFIGFGRTLGGSSSLSGRLACGEGGGGAGRDAFRPGLTDTSPSPSPPSSLSSAVTLVEDELAVETASTHSRCTLWANSGDSGMPAPGAVEGEKPEET